jgi:tryptophan-rich sensory protein
MTDALRMRRSGDLRRRRRPVIAAALAAGAVGALGALSTQLGSWYYQLRKPGWQPPDWLFGPAWTLIFALAALAAVVYWRREGDRDSRLLVLVAFTLNGFLNTLWSLLFFRLHRPDWSLYEVGFLWASILLLMVLLDRASRAAATLLLPYLAWVSFAAFLNWEIVQLNAPFAGGG